GHTKGPWTLTHISGDNFAVQEFEIRGVFFGKPNVSSIFNKNTSAIDGRSVFCSPQDARLINAAPALLAEVERLKKGMVEAALVLLNNDKAEALRWAQGISMEIGHPGEVMVGYNADALNAANRELERLKVEKAELDALLGRARD